MKEDQKIVRWILSCLVVLPFVLTMDVSGQDVDFKVLYSFDGTNGANPVGALVLGRDGSLYGTTEYGGTNGGSQGFGTVYKVTLDGVLTSLASFNGENGFTPQAPLISGNDGEFYGTTFNGGTNGGDGTVFKIDTNGMLTSLVSLQYPGGFMPRTGLVLGNDGVFYGTTYGGSNGYGAVIEVTSNGNLTTPFSFDFDNGSDPNKLTLGSDGKVYGTTRSGGTNGPTGTMFEIGPDGSLTTLSFFTDTGSANPTGFVLGKDGNFYGTSGGGADASGSIFKATTNGTITTLAFFNNDNGFSPTGLMLGDDGNFYGTTLLGGTNGGMGGQGTVFKVTSTGVLTSLFSFNGTNGSQPTGVTMGADGNLYGVANGGGNYGLGTVFQLILPPSIYNFAAVSNSFDFSIRSSGGSTNRIWFTTNVSIPFNEWQLIATDVADAKGEFHFTDTNVSGYPVKFYRVSRP